MKFKLILVLLISLSCTKAFSQVSSLINNFKDDYINGDIENYIDEGERIVDRLELEEKNYGKRVLDLFKLLTGQQQSMSNGEFNKAMRDLGMSTFVHRTINSNLSLIYLKIGSKRSYLVYNNSPKSYMFKFKGVYQTSTSTDSNNFDGGIFGNNVRIIKYTSIPYNYSIVSVK